MKGTICIVFLVCFELGFSQGFKKSGMYRFIQKTLNDTSSKENKSFLWYPYLSYTPESKVVFGLSLVSAGYAKKDTSNKLSQSNTYGFITLAKQFGLENDHNYFSSRNKWFLLGKAKVLSFPLNYYGIGVSTDKEADAIVESIQSTWRERISRKIVNNLYLGLVFDFNAISKVQFHGFDRCMYILPKGANGSVNFGEGLSLSLDQRKNLLNPRSGWFLEINGMHYNFRKQNQFKSLNIDVRKYFSVFKKQVLAMQLFGNFNSNEPSFNLLATLGGENNMRGFYQGRFRDRNASSIQVEYRLLPVYKRFGATLFYSAGTVSRNIQSMPMSPLKHAAGLGFRYCIFPSKDVYLRADYALTRESYGFYLSIGEAF
jgi:outer membrane protein assembly factor BamA